MADTTHQVDRLKEQIDAGAHETKSYLDTKNVQEYDEKHPNAQKATEYLCAGIDKAQASVEELMRVGKKLSEKSKDTSDKSMELAKSSLSNVKASLDAIQHTAHEYDAKFLNSSGSSAVESVESVVNSARQRSTDVIEMASEQLTRMKDSMQNAASSAASSAGHGVQVAAGEAVLVGEKIDEKLGASEKASSAAGKVAETVMNLDKRMHVTETAAMIDSKVTGGLGASVVHKGVEMVQESITYLADTLQQAKIAATKSGTAQAKAGTAKEGVKQKATEAKEGAQEMAGSAQEKASQTSGSMKEGAQEMAGNMQAKGAHGKGSMEQGVHGAEETAAEKAGAAQEGARSMAGTAQQRGGEAKQAVEQTAHGAVEKAKDVGTGAKEAAMGMASGESATDERRKQAQQGGEGESGTEKVKDKAADTMSQSKSVMKDSTKTS
ncbi:hypothetical protein PybrP1_010563 [[Pythium] brassicae (nom. inval.)]|nr:hypothetical protein PybrP1_010563 [[Pythium] brassicae (nom. inval.)]